MSSTKIRMLRRLSMRRESGESKAVREGEEGVTRRVLL